MTVVTFLGCKVGPNYERPAVEMPANWSGPTEVGAGTSLMLWKMPDAELAEWGRVR